MGKDKGKTGPLSRRPDNSAFKQQRLPAWSPMLTASTVLPFFYLASLLCLVLGVVLIVTVKSTQELKVSLVFLFGKPVGSARPGRVAEEGNKRRRE